MTFGGERQNRLSEQEIEEFLASLYQEQANRLFNLALRLVGDKGRAEDVVQETFLRAWKGFAGFRGECSIKTWLFRILVNVCRDLVRRRTLPWGQEGDTETMPAKIEPAIDRLAQERVLWALSRLPEGSREVLVLHDLMDHSHSEIAEMLRLDEGTSKSQLHKARARMRALLQPLGILSAE